MRFATWLVAIFCTTGIANGQSKASHIPATDAKQAASKSLAELRAIGLKHSTYRTKKTQQVDVKAPKANLGEFRASIGPILKEHCVKCHGAEKKEGNIRIDTLDPNLLKGKDVSWWLEVAAVLTNGEMPPVDAPELSDANRSKIIDWLSSEIQTASVVRRAEHGHSSFRRMTRYEYKYALQDLLGLPFDFAKDLPPESSSEDGFKNSSELLHMSVVQFQTYRQLARTALLRATVSGEQPKPLYWSASMEVAADKLFQELDKKEKEKNKDKKRRRRNGRKNRPGHAHYLDIKTGRTERIPWSYYSAKYAWKPSSSAPEPPPLFNRVGILPPRQKLTVELGNKVPDRGLLKVRVRASRTSTADEHPPSLQLEFGWQASNDSSASFRVSQRDLVIDASPGAPRFYEFNIPLSEVYPRNNVRRTAKLGGLPNSSELVRLVNSTVSSGDIQIDYVEVISPVYPKWPPDSHRRIFVERKKDIDDQQYANEVIGRFMNRAWRRKATAAELKQKLTLYKTIRPKCDSSQEAIVEVLASVISSPKFLYLARSAPASKSEKHEELSDIELATRLAVFLWASSPDAELIRMAEGNQLSNPAVLLKQTRRMLTDSKAERFSRHFVRQWLGMQLLDFLNVDRKAFPQFDPSLKEAMQHEPVAFFHELLKHNQSILDFLHADFTMVNERLAKHYGIKNVYGNEFRRVSINDQMRRGGLLTQAGLLAMNSDGKDSHPLKRGIWLLERLLNDPPPPPPPAVPEIDLADPEIAKLTLKQRIEDHRNHAACMSCHAKIDPWGIAFENYDALGRWRTEVKGKPVDATSQLFNQEKLDGMSGLKGYLLKNRQDQFARAMAHKMSSYALGRPLTFGDRSSIDQITADLRKQGDGLATMVELIVTSKLFKSK